MSLAENTRRNLALSHISKTMAAGTYTDADLEKWGEEVGEKTVAELAEQHPRKEPPKKASKK